MIDSPVTYHTFWVIILHQEATITSIYRLTREFFLYKGVGSRTASTFILITTIFALAFPTFINSMTGYTTKNGAFVEMTDGNNIPLVSFGNLFYVIHDGQRINLTDDYDVVDGTCMLLPRSPTIAPTCTALGRLVHVGELHDSPLWSANRSA